MPLPNILPTPNTSRKHSVLSTTTTTSTPSSQPPSNTTNNTTTTTSTTPSNSTTTANNNSSNVNSSNNHENTSLHPSSAATSQKKGKVLGMISMFENLNPEKGQQTKAPTTTSEKIALSSALQDEEKKKRFRARSNSFDLNSPSTTSVASVTNNFTVVTANNQVSNNVKKEPTPNIFQNISKNIYTNINTQLNNNNTSNTSNHANINNTNVNNNQHLHEEEEKSRLTRTPSMVQGLKARFEKLQFSVLEQIKKEEEWMQKKKERQLTARSHKDESHQSSHRSDTSSCESESNNRHSIELLNSHNQKHNDSLMMYDHELVSTDDEYSEEDDQEIHMMETEEHNHQISEKRRSQEERIHQHVFDTLMISPPPQLVAGMAAQSRQSLFYHELYGETASSSTPSPMDVMDSSGTSAMNNDDWLESQMNRHQRYNISDLDLLTAYRHKSQIYQMQNPANVMMNPFIQESQVVLGGDDEEEDYAEEGEYLSSDNDQVDIDPEHRRSSVDMIGGVLDRQNEEEFTSWEKQMEEFGKALII